MSKPVNDAEYKSVCEENDRLRAELATEKQRLDYHEKNWLLGRVGFSSSNGWILNWGSRPTFQNLREVTDAAIRIEPEAGGEKSSER